MSTFDKIRQATENTIHYLWGGLSRIFSPTDDEYPSTGVQPYEGDPATDKRHRRHG